MQRRVEREPGTTMGATRSTRRARVGVLTLALSLALAGWAMPVGAAPPTAGGTASAAAGEPPIADPGAYDPNAPDPCKANNTRLLPKSGQCTHGPDPAPPGNDIQRSTPAVDSSKARMAPGLPCDGDGMTGKRTHVVYVRASDKPDRYSTYLASFRLWAAAADQIYGATATDTGPGRHIRFVQETNCAIKVDNVTVTATGDDNFDNTISQLQQQGYNRTDRKYMLFVDANVYCGIGNIWGDDQPGRANLNNGGPSYGRTDSGCWGNGRTPAHEHMHNLGGVQLTAAHTSGGWHCVDEWDVMC